MSEIIQLLEDKSPCPLKKCQIPSNCDYQLLIISIRTFYDYYTRRKKPHNIQSMTKLKNT